MSMRQPIGIDQLPRVRMLRMREHFGGRATFDHIAALQHQHVFGIGADQWQIVADQHQAEAVLAAQRIEQIQHIARDPRIEGGGRFVGDQILRPAAKRQCDRDALPLSAGKLVRTPSQRRCRFRQLHAFEQRARFGVRLPVRAQGFGQLRADRAQRMQRSQWILRHPADHTTAQRRM